MLKGKVAPQIPPQLEMLRYQPHLLLDYLRRSLLLDVSKQKGVQYEGLAAAGRAAKPIIGSKLASKLRLVDEAYNLVRHLSPESVAICLADLHKALDTNLTNDCSHPSDGDGSSCIWTDMDTASSAVAPHSIPCNVYVELKPDNLDVWFAKDVEADLEEIFGSLSEKTEVVKSVEVRGSSLTRPKEPLRCKHDWADMQDSDIESSAIASPESTLPVNGGTVGYHRNLVDSVDFCCQTDIGKTNNASIQTERIGDATQTCETECQTTACTILTQAPPELSILTDFWEFGKLHGMDERLLFQILHLRMQLDKSFEHAYSQGDAERQALLAKAKVICEGGFS